MLLIDMYEVLSYVQECTVLPEGKGVEIRILDRYIRDLAA